MFTRGVVVEKFYPISYLTIKKLKKTNKQTNKTKIKQKQKRPFFEGEGFLPTFLPIFIFEKEL